MYTLEEGDIFTDTKRDTQYAYLRLTVDKEKYDSMTDFELVDELSRIGHVAVPKAIEEIRTAKVLHDTVCEVAEMPEVVKKFLAI